MMEVGNATNVVLEDVQKCKIRVLIKDQSETKRLIEEEQRKVNESNL